MYCLVVVNANAISCVERLVSEMTCYLSSGTLYSTNSTQSLGNGAVVVEWVLLDFISMAKSLETSNGQIGHVAA